MSEQLLQTEGHPIGRYRYYTLGATTLRQLKQAGIIRGRIDRELLGKKPDGLITLRDGTPRAVVEYKPPSKLKTARQIQKAIDQELPVAAGLGKIFIVSSGSKSIWINASNGERVRSDADTQIEFVVDAKALARGQGNPEEFELLLDAAQASLTPTNNTLAAPEVKDPSVLAKTVWQKIWVQTGKTPEKCLYNVVELFVFKFLSDLGVLKPHNDFWRVENLARRETATDALKYYANTCRKEIKELFPPGGDGTSIINGTIFVNEDGDANTAQATLFAEIIDDLAEYDRDVGSFRYIKREFKTRLYESFLRQSAGIKALGQYFTPRNVVQAMVRMARHVNPGARICDPFCGVGGFVLELLMERRDIYTQFVPREGKVDPQITLVGYDKGTDEQEDERTIILAKANMLIYFSDLLAQHHSREELQTFCSKALNSVFQLIRSNLGTFALIDDEPYDLIVTNPPYVTKGSSSLQAAIAQCPRTAQFYDFGLKGTEGLALNWIVKKLRPGGEALVIVPDSLLRRGLELRALRAHCLIRAVVSLPARTFYATPRQTYILALEKKHDTSEQRDPVFSYIVQTIGETRDANRLETTENDLTEMVNLFRQFRGAPTSFETQSPRCKVVSFSEAKDRHDWRIDRWWSHEERVALGLDTARPVMSDNDFIASIERFAQNLKEMAGRCRADAEGKPTQAMKKTNLCDPETFAFVTTTTGWNERTLHKLKSNDVDRVPVYRAAADACAWVAPTHGNRVQASNMEPLISFAANGDGSAGANFIVHETPFYVTGDRTVLRIVNEQIDAHYLVYALRNTKARHGFDHTHKAVPGNLGEVTVVIPVTEDGDWDLEAQREIARRHAHIRALQEALRTQSAATNTLDIRINC